MFARTKCVSHHPVRLVSRWNFHTLLALVTHVYAACAFDGEPQEMKITTRYELILLMLKLKCIIAIHVYPSMVRAKCVYTIQIWDSLIIRQSFKLVTD